MILRLRRLFIRSSIHIQCTKVNNSIMPSSDDQKMEAAGTQPDKWALKNRHKISEFDL